MNASTTPDPQPQKSRRAALRAELKGLAVLYLVFTGVCLLAASQCVDDRQPPRAAEGGR